MLPAPSSPPGHGGSFGPTALSRDQGQCGHGATPVPGPSAQPGGSPWHRPTCPPAAAATPPHPGAGGCAGAGSGAPSPSGPPGRAAVAQRRPRRASATGASGRRAAVPSASAAQPQPGGRGEQRGAGGQNRGAHPSPLSPPTCPGQAYLSEQPLISSRMSPASTTSSTSAWLSGSTLVTKTRPSTYLGVQPSLNLLSGTLPGSPFVPCMTFHPYTEFREKPPHGQQILARLS